MPGSGRDKPINNWRLWTLLALFACIAVLNGHALYLLWRLAIANPEYSHILLVPPIVLAFVLLDRRNEKSPRSSWLAGAGLAAVALAFWFAAGSGPASLDETLRVSAIVFAIWVSILLVYGWGIFRAALFPMMFLLLLIPWPSVAVDKLTELLQSGSTTASYWFFKAAGVPVTRQGFVLSLPSMDIEVAKECSGIRSTVMLFVTALVLGQWYLRSAWRKLLLALLVIPIGILRNGLRIFILSVLGSYVNEGWLEGNLHHRGGSVFFALGLATIVLILWLFRRSETRAAGNLADSSNNVTLPEARIGL